LHHHLPHHKKGAQLRPANLGINLGNQPSPCRIFFSFNSTDTLEKNENKLTASLAAFVHLSGLSFSTTENPLLRRVLKHASRVNLDNYKLPDRKKMSGPLLESQYQTITDQNKQRLKVEASLFGLSFMGDGATVKRMPLVNMMAVGVHCPPATIEIADCSGYMITGGKKDAEFIANQFLPKLEEYDPNKELVDIVAFDGAYNVQKAGLLLTIPYPGITVLNGIEHCVALFFKDLSKFPVVKDVIYRRNRMYMVFGSGIYHSSHATFKAKAKEFNNGKDIGLLRASPTRMAGYFYAFARDLRLRRAFVATKSSHTFIKRTGKKDKEKRAAMDIEDTTFWKRMYVLCKATLPALKLLRLADSNKPCMDMVLYYCHQFHDSMTQHLRWLSDDELFPDSITFAPDKELDNDQCGTDIIDKDEKSNQKSNEKSNVKKKTGANVLPHILPPLTCLQAHEGEERISDEGETEIGEDNDDDHDDNTAVYLKMLVSSKLCHVLPHCWHKRENNIISSYAVVGWLLSVVPEVRAQVSKEFNNWHQ